MQINTYAQLVNFIATNELFYKVSIDNNVELTTFGIEFMLADKAIFAIVSAEAQDTDESVLHEMLLDDVYGHKMYAV